MLKKFIIDEKGSIAHFITVFLILCILIGTANMSLTIIYKNRTIIRDALDAACTSALAGATEERWRATIYNEFTEIKFDNNYNMEILYRSDEDLEKSYMYIDRDMAKEIFTDILNKNLSMNIKNYAINDIKIEFEYDGNSIEKVIKERYEVSLNPESWWKYEFEGTDTIIKNYYSPDPWDSRPYDNKNVIFPRWVKIKAYADIRINVPMVGIINAFKTTNDDIKDTITISHYNETVKELQTQDREEQERYQGE